jgi:predicted N-formylglutamate amidohydrolase
MNIAPILLLTCEHGGARVPASYRALFAGRAGLLRTHRACDRGSLPIARGLARQLDAPLIAATVSRLVVDLNRSPGHPRLLSAATRGLPPGARDRLMARYYHPHRRRIAAWIADHVAANTPVLHVAIHTFTPVLRGVRRDVDIGVLYDPARALERRLARAWVVALRAERPRLRVRLNAPYRGTADGLTRSLRKQFTDATYAGIELEVNQRLVRGRGVQALCEALSASLHAARGGTAACRQRSP